MQKNLTRSLSRLAAVKALYLHELTGEDHKKIIDNFIDNYISITSASNEDKIDFSIMDNDLFQILVVNVVNRCEEIDIIINNNLTDKWPDNRLEVILRSILRAAVVELMGIVDVPAAVIISEYVDITHAFYNGVEPNMANAVLDSIAKLLSNEDNIHSPLHKHKG